MPSHICSKSNVYVPSQYFYVLRHGYSIPNFQTPTSAVSQSVLESILPSRNLGGCRCKRANRFSWDHSIEVLIQQKREKILNFPMLMDRKLKVKREVEKKSWTEQKGGGKSSPTGKGMGSKEARQTKSILSALQDHQPTHEHTSQHITQIPKIHQKTQKTHLFTSFCTNIFATVQESSQKWAVVMGQQYQE